MLKTILWAGLFAISGHALAAPRSEAGGDNALRQAQVQMQRLVAERNGLQKENAELTAKLTELERRVEQLEAEGEQSKGELKQAQGANEQLRARVERDSERYQDLSTRHTQTASSLRDAHADIALLQDAVREREHWIAACQQKNDGLYQANSELLAAYRDKGAWDALKQRDPLTGIGAVQVENAVQEYRFRLEDLRTLEFEPTSSGQAE